MAAGAGGARYRRMSLAVGVLAVIAVVAALYLARAFIVPLLIGLLASYALSPVVEWLKAIHIPRPIAAALVLAVLVGGASWVAWSLRDDAAAMIEKLPEAARKLRQQLSAARTSGPTALQNVQDAAKELEGATAEAAGDKKKPAVRPIAARDTEPTAWLRDYMLAQSALAINVAAQTPIVILLTYFLLASGGHFRRRLVQLVGPSLSRKKDAVRILEEIDAQLQRYLFAMLVSNSLLAAATWLSFEALGMDQAGVWGIAAGLLHFVPYLGPALIAFASGVAAFLQFGSMLHAFVVAGVSLLVAGAIGLVFMNWLQSRFARMNAAVLFISLLFFAWLWGIWGLLIGAPMVGTIKVICDRVESLKPAGELLGH
jgi:predicted PurR-regulated permease PerM